MPPSRGRVSTTASVLRSIMARKRFSLVCSARSRRFRPQAASATSASIAIEVRRVRWAVKRVSRSHTSVTERSVLPLAINSGKPRIMAIEAMSGSLVTRLVVGPS